MANELIKGRRILLNFKLFFLFLNFPSRNLQWKFLFLKIFLFPLEITLRGEKNFFTNPFKKRNTLVNQDSFITFPFSQTAKLSFHSNFNFSFQKKLFVCFYFFGEEEFICRAMIFRVFFFFFFSKYKSVLWTDYAMWQLTGPVLFSFSSAIVNGGRPGANETFQHRHTVVLNFCLISWNPI